MTNPFAFLIGCPRSGTTLLQRMMDAHHQVAIVPEVGWIPRRYEKREGLTPEGLVTPALIRELADGGGLGRYASLPVSREELENLLVSGCAMSYAALITMLFDRYGEARGKALVGNKDVEYGPSLRTLHSLWPHAKIVHLIRDGRDVCLSAIHWRRAAKLAERFETWNEDPASTAALWWEWHVQPAREVGRSLGPALYYEIRYESLVIRPAEESKALCRFLSVPYDDAMLRFHENGRARDPAADAKHARLPPTPGLRDWRSQMPRADVERFEACAGSLLDELGYARGAGRLHSATLQHAARIRRLFRTS